MKTGVLLGAAILLGAFNSLADNCRYVTVTCTNANGVASVAIQEGETGEVVCSGGEASSTQVVKNGLTFTAFCSLAVSTVPETIIAGPANFTLTLGSGSHLAYMTVKITPSTYDVNKTLILPPGTNQVYVGLESSTNLVNWADSTNGIYGSPINACFFRIRMGQLPSP